MRLTSTTDNTLGGCTVVIVEVLQFLLGVLFYKKVLKVPLRQNEML